MSENDAAVRVQQSVEKAAPRKCPNLRWLRFRLSTWRCRHDWMVGDRKTGAKACAKCGVWRWFPVTTRYGRAWR